MEDGMDIRPPLAPRPWAGCPTMLRGCPPLPRPAPPVPGDCTALPREPSQTHAPRRSRPPPAHSPGEPQRGCGTTPATGRRGGKGRCATPARPLRDRLPAGAVYAGGTGQYRDRFGNLDRRHQKHLRNAGFRLPPDHPASRFRLFLRGPHGVACFFGADFFAFLLFGFGSASAGAAFCCSASFAARAFSSARASL